jgi:hypothetical protein
LWAFSADRGEIGRPSAEMISSAEVALTCLFRSRLRLTPLIREAALNLDSIEAIYEAHVRRSSPHILGARHAERRVVAYQFGGTSPDGLGPDGSADNWRCFPVDKLTNVALIAGSWRSPTIFGTHREQCIDQIDVTARISPDREQCELDEAA